MILREHPRSSSFQILWKNGKLVPRRVGKTSENFWVYSGMVWPDVWLSYHQAKPGTEFLTGVNYPMDPLPFQWNHIESPFGSSIFISDLWWFFGKIMENWWTSDLHGFFSRDDFLRTNKKLAEDYSSGEWTWDVQICAATFTTDRGSPTLVVSVAGRK